jgi:hypothetical protein
MIVKMLPMMTSAKPDCTYNPFEGQHYLTLGLIEVTLTVEEIDRLILVLEASRHEHSQEEYDDLWRMLEAEEREEEDHR